MPEDQGRGSARQFVLDLPVETRLGREDFLVSGSNEAAFGLIERWPDWTAPSLLIEGPAGSGKSHLAAIWAGRADATIVSAADIFGPAVPDLALSPALAIEDWDRGVLDEPALFHLLNLARERRTSLLFTSRTSASQIVTPDLRSRLRLAARVELGPPDDLLLRAVLVKLFADRQLTVDVGVIAYVATRIERSLARAAEIVDALDHEALSRGRRITRPMAAFVVGAATSDEATDHLDLDGGPASS